MPLSWPASRSGSAKSSGCGVTGFYESQNPILKPLDTIEYRDAILAPDSAEPD